MDSVGDQTINLPIGALARPAAPTVVDALVVLGRDGSFGTASREVSLSDGLLRDGVLQPLPPGGRAALDRLPLTIGRAAPADLMLSDVTVSRRHCRLSRAGNRVRLDDLGSTNGTFVNGTPVDPGGVELQDGALIQVAARTLRYERRSHAAAAADAALDQDLRDASDYVAAILPPPLSSGAVQAEWFFRPSSRLSGDAFGYRWLDAERFAFFLIDVAGHGTAAALHAVSIANALRQQMLPNVDFGAPDAVLRALNRSFPMERHDDRFATIWYGVYDHPTRRLAYASGGHHPAYLLAPGADPVPLATRNPAIGMVPDRAMQAGACTVPRDGMLHLFSDGAFDLGGPEGEALDLAGLVRLLPDSATPRGLYEAILRRVGAAAIEDDLSVLSFRFA